MQLSNDPRAARILSETFINSCEIWAELDSTNNRAAQFSRSPLEMLPLLVWAERQTAGRGRGTNRWWTGDGSLAISVLLDAVEPKAAPRFGERCVSSGIEALNHCSDCASADAQAASARPTSTTSNGRSPLASLAVGLAVIDAVQPFSAERVGLHWPNDVFVAGRKLAGILIEVLPNGRQVIGIGINVNNRSIAAPQQIRGRTIGLAELFGADVDRTSLAISLLQHLQRRLDELRSHPQTIAAAADRACLQRGWTLTVRNDEGETTGRCEGIDQFGRLVLAVPPIGIRFFSSGTLADDPR